MEGATNTIHNHYEWETSTRYTTSTNTLSRMLPTPHLELLGKRRTWVTPYQEVQTSRSAPESNDAPEVNTVRSLVKKT